MSTPKSSGEVHTRRCTKSHAVAKRQFPDNRFQRFMDDLLSYGGSWDSISFGRHPFETNHRDGERPSYRWSGNSNMRLIYELLWRKFGDEGYSPMNVRCLRLTLLRGTEHDLGKFGELSNIVTDTLVEL